MRARSGRRGRGGADRWASPSWHVSAGRRLCQARYRGNADSSRHEYAHSDAGDDDDNDDGKASDGA
eukprot:6250119-Pyramimonas_sp.AAC.1